VAQAVARSDGIALLLAGAMCSLPFVIPYHQAPIASFYAEWLAAALGVMSMLSMLVAQGRPVERIPLAGVCLACFGLLLVARALLGNPPYAQLPLIGAAYILLVVCVLWLGAQLARTTGLERTAEILCGFILAGALFNALAGITQGYGRPAWLEDVVSSGSGERAFGNIAQPNLYANYLAIGQAALLYLWAQRRLGHGATLLMAAVLVWGSALSASRMALLYPIMFAGLAACVWRNRTIGPGRPLLAATLALCIAEVVAHAVVPHLRSGPESALSYGWTFSRAVDASQQLHFAGWEAATRVFFQAPLLGAGFGEFAGAAFAAGMPDSIADGRTVWTSPHNLGLHLLAETGIAGAVLAGAALLAWAARALGEFLRDASHARWLLISATGVGLLHSMVEFPLWSAHFLTLTGLLMGASLAGGSAVRCSAVLRATGVVACFVLGATLSWTLRDYWLLDSTRVTGTGATLGGNMPDDARTLTGLSTGPLGPMAETWLFTKLTPANAELPGQLQMSSRVVRYWPSHAFVAKRAVLLAMAGDATAAQQLMQKVSRSHPAVRLEIRQVLREAQAQAPEAVGLLSAGFVATQ
jgi:O-antigen ligase